MFRPLMLVVTALVVLLVHAARGAEDRPSFQFFDPMPAAAAEAPSFQFFEAPIVAKSTDPRPLAHAYKPMVGSEAMVEALQSAEDELPVRLEWSVDSGFKSNEYPVVHFKDRAGQWSYLTRASKAALDKEFPKVVTSAAGHWEWRQVCNRGVCSNQLVWIP